MGLTHGAARGAGFGATGDGGAALGTVFAVHFDERDPENCKLGWESKSVVFSKLTEQNSYVKVYCWRRVL